MTAPAPTLNVAIQSWHTFVASLPPDTRMTLARLTYDISVGAIGAYDEIVAELMPAELPFRGMAIKLVQGGGTGLINTLAVGLEQKLEA